MALYQFRRKQLIHASLDDVWDFISTPKNLQEITPSDMGFEITSPWLPKSIYAGMIISYKIQLAPFIKTTWVTEITQVKEKRYFVDEQRIGPYSLWHHQHIIRPVKDGVLMEDIVSYRPPLGFIGAFFNRIYIKRKLKQIFDFRKEALKKKFVKLKAIRRSSQPSPKLTRVMQKPINEVLYSIH